MKIIPMSIECLGYKLAANLYENGGDTILLCLNGRTATMDSFGYMIDSVVSRTGFDALHFDYSGHGDSKFDWEDISAAEQFIEVLKAFDWIKSNYPNKKIYVFGTSFGGYLATQLTKYRAFDKLVLAAPAIYPVDSFYEPARVTHGGTVEEVAKLRNDFDRLMEHSILREASKSFNNPALVVVHENDEFIPRTTIDAYIKSFNADELLIKDLPHSTEADGISKNKLEEYQNKIAQWLNR